MLRTVEVVPRSRLLRAFWTIVWFFPIAFFSRIAVGAVVGAMAGAQAGDAAGKAAKSMEIGARAADAFFAEYGVVVLACQVGVVMALGLRGILPGTGRERLVASGDALVDTEATASPPAPVWTPVMQPETGFPVRRSATGGLSLWAVIAGLLGSVLVGVVAGFFFVVWQFWQLAGSGLSPQEMGDALRESMLHERALHALAAISTFGTVFGGIVAARVGKAAPWTNAIAYAVVSLLLSVLFSGAYPAWYNWFGYAMILPASLLGGWIGKPAGRS